MGFAIDVFPIAIEGQATDRAVEVSSGVEENGLGKNIGYLISWGTGRSWKLLKKFLPFMIEEGRRESLSRGLM